MMDIMIKFIKKLIADFNDPIGDLRFGYAIQPEDQETNGGRGTSEVQPTDEEDRS